jgi:alkylated DNA repair dioxygenase AlkB
LDRVNEDAPAKYNQVVVNWYEVGHDFTPSHFDCVRGMVPGATVATVSLVERSDAAPRHLVFKPTKAVAAADRRHLRIPTAHGQCVTFGGAALSDWRHGVPAATAPHGAPERAVSRRVSLTFRAYRAS